MGERMRLCVLTLFQVLHFAASVFFHEPSAIMLKPDELVSPQSDFGFAMGYQKRESPNLVISAPNNDLDGKVYSCGLSDLFNSNMSCKNVEIDINKIANETARVTSPKQKFYLGASIAATSDYFLTCAPMWTRHTVKMMDDLLTDINLPYGTCFVYNDTAAYRYKGSMERFLGESPISVYIGGTGWNTLVDETNGLLLVAKTSLVGDILYLKLQDVLNDSKSIRTGDGLTSSYIELMRNTEFGKDFNNVGFGLTAGNFFSNATTYAFNADYEIMIGCVLFLEYDSQDDDLALIFNEDDKPYEIKHEEAGIMFGSALGGADINLDGFSELLVGAPAQANINGDGAEFGAVHIYLGGDIKTITDKNRMRSIFGIKEGARFGSAIATNDIDGDNIPEIFVSAPYENSGEGAVYILSGQELNKMLIGRGGFKQIQVSELLLTQTIQREGYRAFGFSLQVIPDVDNNGCNELAIGSPGNATVLLLRCMQVVNVTISSRLPGAQIVREQDNNFTVEVCINIAYNEKLKSATGKLLVTNNIIGDRVQIKSPNFYVDLSERSKSHCENITVFIIGNNEPAEYRFVTKIKLQSDSSSKEFNDKWVVLSPYSEVEKKLEISRHCAGEDCKPKLSMKINWSGGNETYTLGSTKVEKVTVLVRNDGNNSYDACAWLSVNGARLAQIECVDQNDGYLCQLPKPLRRNTEYSLNIYLNMSNPRNSDTRLKVDVELYENCRKKNHTSESFERLYELNLENVFLDGSSRDSNITDKEVLNNEIVSLKSSHEYYITNNGSITWLDVHAELEINGTFMEKLTVSSTATDKCEKRDNEGKVMFNCKFNLMPNSTIKLTAFMEISKKIIDNKLVDLNGKDNTIIIITSNLSLFLMPSPIILQKRLSTAITYQKVLTVGNNKNIIILIATIFAVIVLGIIVGVLYKLGFFKRKEKKRLNELRESIRKRSVKNPSEKNDPKSSKDEDNENPSEKKDQKTSEDGDENFDIEIVDDCAFDEDKGGQTSTNDNVMLIEEKAEVHC